MKKRLEGITLLKLLAAFQVLYLHLIVHYELVPWKISGTDVLGKLLSPFQGVPIFFALSGYFIWKSLSSNKEITVKEYAYRRFVRIYPELWVTVCFSVLSIVILYRNSISIVPFLAWIFTQSTVMQFWTPTCLRGYGVGCPNGALWTVTVFVQFYILVFILHRLLHGKSKFKWGGVLLVAMLLNVIPSFFENSMPEILFKLYQQTVFPYLSIFLFAAFIAEHEDELKRLLNCKWICIILYVVLAIGLPVDFTGAGYAIVRSALVTIFAIVFGNTVKCGLLKKDISYEIYLIHMPIANIFVELLKQQSWVTFIITIMIAIILAYVLYCLNNTVIRKMENN